MRASLLTSVAGWWGVPWGPIYTVTDIVRNAFGGYEPPGSRDILTWRNAVAFAAQGNHELAYALARAVMNAKDENISQSAIRLMDYLRSCGVDTHSASLKSAWSLSPLFVALQLIALVAVPTAMTMAIAFSPDRAADLTNVSGPADMSGGQSSSGQSSASSPAAAIETPDTPHCGTPPANGDVIDRGTSGDATGQNVVEIRNGSVGDAIVKIRDANSGRLFVSFFVASGSTANYSVIPDGSYVIQYAFGGDLDPSCSNFLSIAAAGQFPNTETFSRAAEGQYETLSYTLYAVPGGNVSPNAIDASAFNAK